MAIDYRNSFLSTSDGEQYTTVTEREIGNWAALVGSQSGIVTNYFGLVDLSDTVNFPHDHTGRLDFTFIRLSIDKAKTATGSISFGIVTRIDGTNADIVYFANGSFLNNDTPAIEINANISPQQVKSEVSNQRLSRFKTNAVALNVSAVNTGVTLTGPGTNFVPSVGDLIIRVITDGSGAINYVAAVNYHSHPAGAS